MLFDWNAVAAPGQVQDVQPCAPLTLTGDGLWVCLVSSGRCTASVPSAGPLPAGAALLLPPQSVPAGHLVLSRAPLVLEPEGSCHLLCVQLTGQASAQFLAGLHELPFLARGETCPAAAALLGRLAAEADTPRSRAASQLAFALLCLVTFELFAPQLASLFIDDPATIHYSAGFLRRMVIAMPMMSLCYPMIIQFQAMGKARESLVCSILRKGVLDIPLLFLLDTWLPLYGCMWVQPIVDTISLIVAIGFYRALRRREDASP